MVSYLATAMLAVSVLASAPQPVEWKADYGDALAEHDGHVGQLLAKLEATGLDKNTIVVYVTDNGAYQYMWPEGGTSPFRGDKGTTWEGGVRAPCMVRWPGADGGRVSSEIVDMTGWVTVYFLAPAPAEIPYFLK